MHLENLIQFLFFIAITICVLFGCGGIDSEPTEPTEEPTEVDITQEDLLGIWDIRSINGIPAEAFLESPEGEDLQEQEVQIEQFTIIFAENDSWIINLQFGTIFRFPQVPEDPGFFQPDGSIIIDGTWSGIYSVEDSTLTFTADEADVQVESDPEDFMFQVFEVDSQEQAQRQYIEDFDTFILTPFKESTGSLRGNELILIAPLSKKMVLEKR